MIRPLPFRFLRFILVLMLAVGISYEGFAQCVALPLSSGSNSGNTTFGKCSPVTANINYNIGFFTPVPAGTLDIVFKWDDGSTDTVVPQVAGLLTYSAVQGHLFPVNSNCEFEVQILMRHNGVECTSTLQKQRVPSWRTDAFNGGNVQLISPLTGTNEHLVCVGQDINVVFDDLTDFNCNANFIHRPPFPIIEPNDKIRWQQIVYNTPITGSVIPNVTINDGVPSLVTGAGGATLISNLQDVRGVFRMDFPVVINDGRRRSTLPITAPGGFGSGFPQVGDRFQVTLKYWNTCNPFSNNPLTPDVPNNFDFVNGDNLPVTANAIIRIVASPPDPTAASNSVCVGTSLTGVPFKITTPTASTSVNWYQDNAGVPGAPIANPGGTNATSLAASVLGLSNTSVPGTYTVWASYNANPSGVQSCESKKIPISLTIQNGLTIPTAPVFTSPVCSDNTPLTLTVAPPPIEINGGATRYVWSVAAPNDIGLSAVNASTENLDFSTISFGAADFVDRTIQVLREYTSGAGCPSPLLSLPIRVYAPSLKGTTTGGGVFCQGSDAGKMTWSGGRGTIVRWDISTDGGTTFADSGLGNANPLNIGASLVPNVLPATPYIYHAVIQNGPCSNVKGDDISFTINANPLAANAGADQAYCNVLSGSPFGASDPSPGTGTWTVVGKPAAKPDPFISDIHDFNATASIASILDAGVYTFRWTVTNFPCTTSDDVVIDFGGQPTVPTASSPQMFCGLSGILSASAPTFETSKWTKVSGPGNVVFGDDSSPTSTVTADAVGHYTLKWTFSSGSGIGICLPQSVTIDVFFNAPATASVPVNFISCVDPAALAPIAITGTIGGGATNGQWKIFSGSGKFGSSGLSVGSSLSAPVNDTYIPSSLDAGTIKLQLVALDPDGGGPCTDIISSVLTITIDSKPTIVNAGPDQAICSGSTTLAALTPDGNGKWTAAGVTFGAPTSPTSTVSSLPVGTTILHWTVTSTYSTSGGCAAISKDVNILRNPLPIVNNLTPGVCEQAIGTTAANITLINLNGQVIGPTLHRSVQWFTTTPPAGLIASPTTPRVISGTTTTFFTRVYDSLTTCTSGNGTVTYTINALPTVVTSFSKSFCEDFPTGSGKVSNINLGAADIAAGVLGGTPPNRAITWFKDPGATIPITSSGSYKIGADTIVYALVRNTVSGCTSVAPVGLNINHRPPTVTITGKTAVCVGAQEPYSITNNPSDTYQWNIPATFTKFLGGGPNDNIVLIEFPTATNDTVRLRITRDGCQSEEMKKGVLVSATPSPFSIARFDKDSTLAITADAVCENDVGIRYGIPNSNYPGSTYSWDVIPSGSALIATGQTTDKVRVNFLSTAAHPSFSIRVTENTTSNCSGPPQSISITVNPRPDLATISAAVCSKENSGIILTETGSVPAAAFNITSIAVSAGLIPLPGNSVSGTAGAHGIENDRFENTTGGPLDVRYTVEPVSADGCAGAAKIVSLTVKPQPVLDPNLDVLKCSGKTVDVIFKVNIGSVAADLFYLDSIKVDAGLIAMPGNVTTGALLAPDISNDRWKNLGTTPLKVIYWVRPSNTNPSTPLLNCTGNPAVPVKVTVYPEPAVDPQTATICSGDNVNMTLTSPVGTSFTWTVKNVTGSVTGARAGAGIQIPDKLFNTSASPGVVTYTVTATSPASLQSCEGPAQDISITVNPAPPVNKITQTICSNVTGGNTLPVDLTSLQPLINSSAGLNFTWYTANPVFFPSTPPIGSPSSYLLQSNVSVFAKVDHGAGTCFNIDTITYTINQKPLVSTTVSNPNGNGFEISCTGKADGQIKATGTQGGIPYQFSIDGGANYFPTGTFNNLGPGLYSIQIQDRNGCSDTLSNISISEPTPISFSLSVTDAQCFNSATGKIQITSVTGGVSGGVGYSFSINGGAFGNPPGNTFSTLAASGYTITVKDGNACTASQPALVGQPTELKGSSHQTNVSCNGKNDGSVTAKGIGGTPPYQYSIDGLHFQADSTFNVLLAGHYTIFVRDATNVCQLPLPIDIAEPATLNLNLTTKQDVSCFGELTGKLQVTASGGTAPYQYSIDGGSTFQFPSSGIFDNLPGGVLYHMFVKDANSCTAVLDVTINQPAAFAGIILTPIKNVSCNGAATGSFTASGSGGSGLYSYSLDGAPFSAVQTFSGLAAGHYTVKVKDANGCQTSAIAVDITEPPLLSANIDTQTNVLCNGFSTGGVVVKAAGGVSPYQFNLNGVINATGSFTNLAQGHYFVQVKDNNGCDVAAPGVEVIIIEPGALSMSTTVNATNCKSDPTGQVKVDVSGGTAPYLYSIDGATFVPGALPLSHTFTGLATGNYLVRVFDGNGCPAPFSSIVITEPTQVFVNVVSTTNVDCKGNNTGSVTLQASGGNVGYTYSKDDISYGSSPTFAGLPVSLNHIFYAKDAHGCRAQVTADINEPALLTLTKNTSIDVLCNGQNTGSVIVDGGGGNAPYQYSIDGAPFTLLNTFNGLVAKTNYKFKVKDSKGCLDSLLVPINEPTALVINSFIKTDAKCFLDPSGTVSMTASGGKPNLHYTLLQDPSNITGRKTGTFTGLLSGTYTVQVTDTVNCTNTKSIKVDQPQQLKASALVTSHFNTYNVSCFGANDGAIVGSVTGGTGTGTDITYTISPDPGSINTNGLFTHLLAGSYVIDAIDLNGCQATTSAPVFLKEPFALVASSIGNEEFICAGSDPTVIKQTVTPFGGVGSYTYQWQSSPDSITFTDITLATAISYDPPVLSQKTYFRQLIKSGANTSCTQTSNVIPVHINPLPQVASIIPSASPICEGGTLLLTINFIGQTPVKYDYTAVTSSGTTTFPNQTNPEIPKFNLRDETTYTITKLKDGNGCESSPNFSITVGVTKVNSTFTIGAPTAQCTGSTYSFKWKVDPAINYLWEWPDGSVLNILPHDPSYPAGDNTATHVLTNGLTSASINLPVKLIATGGVCQDSTTVPVKVYPAVNAILSPVENNICSGTTLNFDNQTQGASIHKWFYREKGTTNQDNVSSTYSTSYTFLNNTAQNPIVYEIIYIGSNANGCSDSDTLDVTVYKNSIAHFDEGTIPLYVGGTSTLNIINNSSLIDAADFTYQWSFGEDAVPKEYTDNATPALPPVVYHSPGAKTIMLIVTNRAHDACTSEFQKTIPIDIPGFSAAFTATPLASCLPTEIVVKNLSGSADSFDWQLKDFAGNLISQSNLNEPTFAITSSGTYTIYLTAKLLSTSQTATAQIEDIEVYERPHATFEARPNPFFVPDTPVQTFADNTAGANHYSWNFGDSRDITDIDEKDASHLYQLEGSYTITLYASYDHGDKNVNGDGVLKNVTCYDTAKVIVKGRQGGQTKIPNAFSPNPSGPTGGTPGANGVNDVFLPITRGVEEFEMQIYDRWGTMVFVSKDKNQGWDGYDRDGNLLPAGVYVFKLTMRLSNGQRTTQVGDVTLLR